MGNNMDASIRFLLPARVKAKFWELCQERGLLPSQVLRETVVNLVDRMELERAYMRSKVEASSSDDS